MDGKFIINQCSYFSQVYYQLFIKMGNSQHWLKVDTTFTNEQDLLQQLIPIEHQHQHNDMLALATFQIYRFKTQPFEILMKHVRVFAPNNAKYVEYADIAKAVTSLVDHRNIARIHSINICTKANICMKQISIESYVNYYAINMEQVINKRKKRDIRLTSNELWYLVNSLSQVSLYLRSLNLFFGVYLAKNIYLSAQGYIKIYLYHLHPQNKHLLYYHLINNEIAQINKYLPIPPECLPYLKIKAQQLMDIDMEKMEVFGIAMIALESMFAHSTKKYYHNNSNINEYSFTFNHSLLQEDIAALRQVYPPNLIYLLEKMTKLNPQERFDLQDIKKYIKDIRNEICISGSIKIIEDEENPILPKVSYRMREDDGNSLLKSVTTNGESRLEFRPLKLSSNALKRKSDDEKQLQGLRSLKSSRVGVSITCSKKENRATLGNMCLGDDQKGKIYQRHRASLRSQR